MRTLGFVLATTLAVVLVLGIAIGAGNALSMRVCFSDAPDAIRTARIARPPRTQTTKPVVAIVLADTQSEVTDVLGPYAMFAASGLYDVVTVASTGTPRTLTGGLEVLPHTTFAMLDDARPGGPDIIVVPAMIMVDAAENAPARAFIAAHAPHATLFAWCAGTEVLAASGAIDERTVTTHWADIGRLEDAYPEVRFVRGVRYVDHGTLVTTAGLTSGIDATLHVLSRRDGPAVADRVRTALGIPRSSFVESPGMAQRDFAAEDAVFVLNGAFHWPKRALGVWLEDGVDELELAAIFDGYTASFTHVAHTLGRTRTVTSRHGLVLVPRGRTHAGLDRVVIPSGGRPTGIDDRVPTLTLDAETFAMMAVVEDLARIDGVATARFAAKRLELRSPLRLEGDALRARVVVLPITIALGVVVALVFARRRRRGAVATRAT